MEKKYPIGTLIQFTCKAFDTGLGGKVVGHKNGYILVYLPKATRPHHIRNGIKYTWICTDENFIVLKNHQLLFEFMYE